MKYAIWLAALLFVASSAQAGPARKGAARKASRSRAAVKAAFNPSSLNTPSARSAGRAASARSTSLANVPSRAFARHAGETPASGPAPVGGALIQTGAAWKVGPGSEEKMHFAAEGNTLIADEGPRGPSLTNHKALQEGPKDKLPTPNPTGDASGGNSIRPNQ